MNWIVTCTRGLWQSATGATEALARGDKGDGEARRAEAGPGVLGEGHPAFSQLARGLGKRCKLPSGVQGKALSAVDFCVV